MMPKGLSGAKKRLEDAAARAVGAGKQVRMETVDFADANRPKTCVEVDFPILPINQIAAIEGNAGKPIYQMSKWWARRRSSVFRSLLIAAATKAPDDPALAAKTVWDAYYSNHQAKGAFSHLKVADIFMGGGTTLVEGSRLGMQMFGVDLNPVAWFVVKQEFADVDMDEVQRLLDDIEAEVKPQIMPFYYCDGPNGEKGTWTHIPTSRVMGDDFDPLSLTPDERKHYRYEGPEIIYTFWAKHGPCQVTGCGHRTPIMSSPVMAVKNLTVKAWEHTCKQCGQTFDVEDKEARMAPDVPLFVAPTEKAYTVMDPHQGVVCPNCNWVEKRLLLQGKDKKVRLSLLVHPEWLSGSDGVDSNGNTFGGASQDDAISTGRWNAERSAHAKLLEVRGELPDEITCPETGAIFRSDRSNLSKRATFICSGCGTSQNVMQSVRQTGRTAPAAAYAVQGYSPKRRARRDSYNGKFFAPFSDRYSRQLTAATEEWHQLKDRSLEPFWPKSEIPEGVTTTKKDVLPNGHGYTHWWMMFNPRQLLVLAHILRAIFEVGTYSSGTREYVLGAFQNYLRNQSMFSFWHLHRDHFAPALSNSNFNPKASSIETGVFSPVGYGSWKSAVVPILHGREWARNPWELVSFNSLNVNKSVSGPAEKSEKVRPGDKVTNASLYNGSATELSMFNSRELDIVITDPPFGHNIQYAELSDFFYVWLRLVLRDKYPELYGSGLVPKALEVVTNYVREPEGSDAYYQRLLTESWRESYRILKPGGILAFTFHHSDDAPWVSVLESLFDAGFYLEATYPIRSDETKGDGEFGSQKIEYDIIHVCRKRTEDSTPVSWARMRREVLADVRQLQYMLENHAKDGLPAADLQVIRRGKALEYYSRHYGKVYVDEGRTMSVKEAVVGINQLIDEDFAATASPLPANAEPITRQFLRMFEKSTEIPRDQMQKFLRGSGIAPDEFVDRGWCVEKNKTFFLVDPLAYAKAWHGRSRRNLASDFDQAWFLVGSCMDGSGISVLETLKNENFKPHPALRSVLEWHSQQGDSQLVRMAARRAITIYDGWASSNHKRVEQLNLFFNEV